MSETEVTTEGQVVDTDNLDAFSADFFGRKEAKPEATTPEAEQEETTEQEVEDPKAQDTEVDPNEDAEAEFKEAPPKKKTVQDRIDELVKQREDAKREGDVKLEALRKEFQEQLAKLQPKQTDQELKATEPQPGDLKEDGTPKYDLGEFDPQYIRDLTRHTLEQERAQAAIKADEDQRVKDQQRQGQELQTSWNEKVETAKVEYPDFEEKGAQLLNGFGNLDQNYATYLSTLLMSMDKGTDVLYYLSSNPEEAVKIVNSGAQRATLALGRIEAKFLEADAEKQLAKPKMSKAPAPAPANVRARGTNGAFVAVAPDTDDLDAFSSEFFKRK